MTVTPLRLAAGTGDDHDNRSEVFVVFTVGDDEYAVAADDVQEVIRLPERLAAVPGAAADVRGVVNLRGDLLPVVNAAARLNVPAGGAAAERVIVLRPAGTSRPVAGITARSVRDVVEVAPADVLVLPSGTTGAGAGRVCRLAGGDRVVTVVDATRLAGGDGWAESPPGRTPDAPAGEAAVAVELVVFAAGDAWFGVDVGAVRGILRHPDKLTPVPDAPAEIAGLGNLRGSVLTVIDGRRVLGLPPAGVGPRTRVLALAAEPPVGVRVDAVSDLLRVPAGSVQPAVDRDLPAFVTGVVDDAAHDRLVLVLDAAPLVAPAGAAVALADNGEDDEDGLR